MCPIANGFVMENTVVPQVNGFTVWPAARGEPMPVVTDQRLWVSPRPQSTLTVELGEFPMFQEIQKSRIDVTCSECKHKFRKTMGDLGKGFHCPRCRVKFIGDDKGMREVKSSFDGFERELKRMFG